MLLVPRLKDGRDLASVVRCQWLEFTDGGFCLYGYISMVIVAEDGYGLCGYISVVRVRRLCCLSC
jgi:hypothetical protein